MIVIRPSKSRLVLAILGSLLLVACSVFPMFARPDWIWICIIGIVFFSFCGGALLYRLFRMTPAVVIHRTGLVDNSSATPSGAVSWNEITRVETVSLLGSTMLGIDVEDRELLYKRSRHAKLMKTNANLTGFPINIPAVTIDRPLPELCELIRKYWQDPDARNQLEDY